MFLVFYMFVFFYDLLFGTIHEFSEETNKKREILKRSHLWCEPIR